MVNMRVVDSPADVVGQTGASGEDYENYVQLTNIRKSSNEDDDGYGNYAESPAELTDLQQLTDRRCNAPCDVNDGGGGTGMDTEKRMRREIANCNERRRMQSINTGFQTLRTLLPRHDGEKMSKASILQQTADMIRTLQAEKEQLARKLERALLDRSSSSTTVSPMTTGDCDSAQTVGARPKILAPPKKRKRFVAEFDTGINTSLVTTAAPTPATGESSDEGIGMMSDDNSAKLTVDDQLISSEKAWETEIVQRQLLELRLAFDRERKIRALLEEELRRRDTNSLRGTMSNMRVSALFNQAASPQQPANAYVSSSADVLVPLSVAYGGGALEATYKPTALIRAPGQVESPALPPSHHQLSIACQQESPTLSYPAAVQQPTACSPSTAAVTVGGQSSKQSLEAICEAIRHLEGEQLFTETSSAHSDHRTITQFSLL